MRRGQFKGWWGVFYGAVLLCTIEGCGKSGLNEDEGVPDGAIVVHGNAFFISDCQLGAVSDPIPARLVGWQCKTSTFNLVEISEPPKPIILKADCSKSALQVTIRDYQIDEYYNIKRDGVFDVVIDGGYLKLANDAAGTGTCYSRSSIEISGKMDCSNVERPVVKIGSYWNLGKLAPRPSREVTLPSGAKTCKLPSDCYLGTEGNLYQCH